MSQPADDLLETLKSALEISPDNVPLLRHYADMLLNFDRPAEAEEQYRKALEKAPTDDDLRLALAHCYLEQDKRSHAAVIVDLLVERDEPLAEAFLLQASLRLTAHDVRGALRAFERAVHRDPAVAETELARRLGLAGATSPGHGEEDGAEPAVHHSAEADREEGAGEEEEDVELPPVERPAVTFSDVGGLDLAKALLRRRLAEPLAHRELFLAYGRVAGGAVLLHGPPGCGKSLLARAAAGDTAANLVAPGLHDILDGWLGGSERNLHLIFEHVQEHVPCVLFLDELDVLVPGGFLPDSSARGRLVRQLAVELARRPAGVLVVAATSTPWRLAPELLGPETFGERLYVPPPDRTVRAEVIEILLRDRPVDAIDAGAIAAATEGFSGADLASAVERAVDARLDAALGNGGPAPIGNEDLLSAVSRVRPSTADWLDAARREPNASDWLS